MARREVKWETEELQRSREQGKWDRWGVHEAYIRDGWLFIEFDQHRIYAPLEHSEIPHQFSKVVDGQDATVLRFVEAYGRLGWSELKEGDGRTSDPYLKAVTNTQRRLARAGMKKNNTDWVYAEPLEWIRVQARTVNWCLNAAEALRDTPAANNERYEQLADALPRPMGCRASVRDRLMRDNIRDKVTPRRFVGGMLEDYLLINLRGVRRRVIFADDGLKALWGGNSLLESIYSLVADAAVAGQLSHCEACGATFVQRDKRQRHCPPRLGQLKSSCMNRIRVRQYRKRKRENA